MIHPPIPSPAAGRRGAASLVVVMVLFFIVTLVAAYASRNLLFEQRTSANQFRSTLAFEAAEAGVEWALARLNDARMNDNCTPFTDPTAVGAQPSFRERYLQIDGDTGAITPVAGRLAGCIFNGTGWTCDCPATGNPNPSVTYTGNGPFAAFWVRFVEVTPLAAGVTGVVRMQVNACTRADEACLNFLATREAQSGDGLATVWSLVTLRSALASAPAAALTVRGDLNGNTRAAAVSNDDTVSGGLTLQTGGALSGGGNLILSSVPGTPGSRSTLVGDSTLVALADLSPALTPDSPVNYGTSRMFNSVFGMWPATYENQLGLAVVNCSSDCTAADVNAQVTLRPGHPVLVRGTAGRLRVDATIGSTTQPVVIVSESNVEFDGGGHSIHGVVYARRPLWDIDGTGTLNGAAIAEGGFRFASDLAITYNRSVISRARYQNGTFVKVPGGWRDFQP